MPTPVSVTLSDMNWRFRHIVLPRRSGVEPLVGGLDNYLSPRLASRLEGIQAQIEQ